MVFIGVECEYKKKTISFIKIFIQNVKIMALLHQKVFEDFLPEKMSIITKKCNKKVLEKLSSLSNWKPGK